ncbi:acyltransferase family protein [Methylomonas sp. EFPC3]|uniref:acyltransferase family protein n=1 Tax=Methylomonas sp. EFPC3 TaxID=3021710 RepID=UPI002416FC95|nr:acyltransferase family protein [Methylomonas sp. EFPC3]WFP49541.1 acyltransferase family protein [Methylomonas sp. EFPC3]
MSSGNVMIEQAAVVKPDSEYNPSLSAFLDFARWVSAFLVLLTHLNNRMFLTLDKIPADDRTLVTYLWGFVAGFAHWGVVIFFVLSGYLVGGPVLKHVLANRPFNLTKYFVARVTRIYLVLIPVLLIGNAFDYIGMAMFPNSEIYAEHLAKLRHQTDLEFKMSIVGSLFNLQNLFVDTLGTNGPLETLANEFWYYVTFPLLLSPLLFRRSFKSWSLFIVGVALFASMSFASKWHFVGFILWCIGAGFSVLAKKPVIKSSFWALAVFLAALIGIRVGVRANVIFGSFGFIFEIIVALLFANLLWSLKYHPANWRLLHWDGHSKLGGFSYSLYAVHVPLLMLLCAAMKNHFGFGWHDIPKSVNQFVAALSLVAVSLSFAWCLSLLTERHTYRVRSFVNGLFVSK